MYNDTVIINPKYNHRYTFILLHPMCCDFTFFNNFINFFKEKYIKFFNYTKFIIPNAEKMDVYYPDNKLINVHSWYNYYTCYDGINKLDEINIDEFSYNTKRIINIIDIESKLLKSYKNIYIYGISQGGTLIFNILKNLSKNIGAVFVSKSIYMKKYINLNNNKKTSIFIYSGKNDQIYKLKFQKKLIKYLEYKKFKINWSIEENIDHFTHSDNEYIFVINNFINTIYL